ncbi:phage portal protein [Sphaerisporangium sp. TRM90804]|uniref:phage portal protein n=1 Tax=Sphaerisporangium sp. TRM90804 TaxID=3031113 RepID=UPI00244B95B1|nr:phage portal protein [Sphaerisporangium sp. TRM90804]MDH2424744.1 phage portal protein [Sphaerisporangium sp. TRM90804]
MIPELPLLALSDDETNVLNALRAELMARRYPLELRDAYYNGEQLVRDLGISIPPQLRGLHTVIGWPQIGVDALEQRLDIEALRYKGEPDSSDELMELWEANELAHESQLGHLDALIYGRAYIAVGSGDCGGDDCPPLISVESPLDMTIFYDARARVTTAALRVYKLDDEDAAVLYLPNSSIHVVQTNTGWVVIDRDDHDLGIVPVVRMANRQRTADRIGHSEITQAVMSITDAACRTLLGMEVAREFYAAPQRYILGASESAFQDAEGNAKSAWETYIGRVLALERDEDGEIPQVGQFAAYDPSAYTRIVDLYARIMATQLGLPPHYLGYTTDNPASADAIRSTEAQLVKRAERKQRLLDGPWANAMRLALLIKTGDLPDRAKRIECVWRNPATPTVAAQTDAAVKLVQAGVLPAGSEVTMELVGLSDGQRRRVQADQKRSQGRQLLTQVGQRINAARAAEAAGVAGE